MQAISSFILLFLPAIVQAHICMWAPVQRKGYSIETPGESLCYLKEGPCGGVASGAPQTALVAGQAFTVYFQQNLNHFYLNNPGKLVVDFALTAEPAEEDFIQLGYVADYNAMNEITQTNFTLTVTIPPTPSEHAVLRLRYVSQNPTENDRGTTFYQCADVSVSSAASAGPALSAAPATTSFLRTNTKASPKEAECCTAPQFSIDGFETSSWRQDTTKRFFYDKTNQLLRLDTNSGSGVTAKDGHFVLLSNFSSGIEYYYNVHADTCSLYGLNYWSDWCYGSANQQQLQQTSVVGYDTVHTWSQDRTPFLWANVHKGCVPLSFSRTDTKESTVFSNMQVSDGFDASVWALPAACVRAQSAVKDLSALPKSVRSQHF